MSERSNADLWRGIREDLHHPTQPRRLPRWRTPEQRIAHYADWWVDLAECCIPHPERWLEAYERCRAYFRDPTRLTQVDIDAAIARKQAGRRS